MPRDLEDLHETLTAFTGWIRDQPAAGVVVGTARIEPGAGYAVRLGHVDCDPVALIVFASEVLATASEMIVASPHADGAGYEPLLRITRAQRALGLRQTESCPVAQ